MVQKGKFSAGMAHLVRVLKSVLLPTLGIPTIPIYDNDNDKVSGAPNGMSPSSFQTCTARVHSQNRPSMYRARDAK
jgi:hypothetical protein